MIDLYKEIDIVHYESVLKILKFVSQCNNAIVKFQIKDPLRYKLQSLTTICYYHKPPIIE